ncbi:MAG: cytochrome b/b6 domain-containing protein [Chloroflexota bacterium]
MAAITETISAGKAADDRITRFDVHQIIQHAGMMASFIVLVLTGLPMKFSSSAISQWWIGVWGGIEVTRTAHHVAAWVIVTVCLYHLAYIGYTTIVLKRPFPARMIPGPQDFIKFFQEIAYFLGLRKEEPAWERFNWREKFDYWAIFWGMPVMGGSGFVLMFPVLVTKFLPGWVVPTALIAHSDEAMLALTWIFMVHIFFNHFTPTMFPLNKAIFTGKVSPEHYRKEHRLEYQRLTGTAPEEEEAD